MGLEFLQDVAIRVQFEKNAVNRLEHQCLVVQVFELDQGPPQWAVQSRARRFRVFLDCLRRGQRVVAIPDREKKNRHRVLQCILVREFPGIGKCL